MHSSPNNPKPRARRGGRPPKPPKAGRDKAVVCAFIVDRVGRGQEACGQVLSNPKQANTHLARQHGLTGKEKTEELSHMGKACPIAVVDGVPSGARDHSWKLMPGEESYHVWCLACGAVEESTAKESQNWVDDMDAEDAFVESTVGPCAMGRCECAWAVPATDSIRVPLDGDVLEALAVCSDPYAVHDTCEIERWTAHQLLLAEAQQRGLDVPQAQSVVLDHAPEPEGDEDDMAGPVPVAEDYRGESDVGRLLAAINGFGFIEYIEQDHLDAVQAMEKESAVNLTVQALALRLARDRGWELPQCQRSVWIPVELTEEEKALMSSRLLPDDWAEDEDEAAPGTP